MIPRRFTLLVSLAVGLSACTDDPPPAKPPAPEVVADAGVAQEASPLTEMRQAYGLPFPPEVRYVRKGANFVEVGTMLTIDELERFFRGRVVDYEFIRPNRNELRLIGLHSTMPRVQVNKVAPNVPISVRYQEQSAAQDAARTTAAAAEERPAPGQPVRVKVGDKELAPGAVYGQPYTPQPGDPLYQDRYRANFGKPFGKWVLN